MEQISSFHMIFFNQVKYALIKDLVHRHDIQQLIIVVFYQSLVHQEY